MSLLLMALMCLIAGRTGVRAPRPASSPAAVEHDGSSSMLQRARLLNLQLSYSIKHILAKKHTEADLQQSKYKKA